MGEQTASSLILVTDSVVHIANTSEVQNISLQFMSCKFPNGILVRILIGEGMHADEMAPEIT